jgi:hypothetical protein
MFEAHQLDRWDHTAQLLAAHSTKPIEPRKLNPYRRRQRGRGITPNELYAVRDALAKRNADR